MNETLKTIHHRRSIRSYKPEQIRDEELKIILDAGCMAPSAMDQQSWHFTVLQNPEILNRLVETAKKALGRDDSFSPLYGAPSMVLVFGRRDAISPISDRLPCHTEYASRCGFHRHRHLLDQLRRPFL